MMLGGGRTVGLSCCPLSEKLELFLVHVLSLPNSAIKKWKNNTNYQTGRLFSCVPAAQEHY